MQISVQLHSSPSEGQGSAGGAKQYAAARTRTRVLQSFGWLIAGLPEQPWRDAGDHERIHIVVDTLKKALGKDEGGGGGGGAGHTHHSGCGCH